MNKISLLLPYLLLFFNKKDLKIVAQQISGQHNITIVLTPPYAKGTIITL